MFNKIKYVGMGAAALTVLSTPLHAAEETANLGVVAVVADTCLLAAGTALSFATINTEAASNEVTPGLVTVTCTSSKSVNVSIGAGENENASTRRMAAAGGAHLPYTIYKDSGRSQSIAIDGELFNGSVTAATPTVLSVYGQIPAGSYSAGAYSDTLLVTLTY